MEFRATSSQAFRLHVLLLYYAAYIYIYIYIFFLLVGVNARNEVCCNRFQIHSFSYSHTLFPAYDSSTLKMTRFNENTLVMQTPLFVSRRARAVTLCNPTFTTCFTVAQVVASPTNAEICQ